MTTSSGGLPHRTHQNGKSAKAITFEGLRHRTLVKQLDKGAMAKPFLKEDRSGSELVDGRAMAKPFLKEDRSGSS